MDKEPRRVSFPQDENEHRYIVEWWYFNGNLEDRRGNQYAFMDCLFKFDIKRIKFPFISELPIPVNNIYSHHSILSDISRQKSYPHIDYVVRPSRDSFRKPLLFVKHGNCHIRKMCNAEYLLKNSQVSLRMKPNKGPMLEGKRGFIVLPGHRSTYYYSLTGMEAQGTVIVNGGPTRVRGRCWMDHQWANVKYKKNKWIWLSMQMDDGTDIMCFEYGKRKAKRLACIMDKNGKQANTTRIRMKPTGTVWTSPYTRTEYPLSWRIEIPCRKAELVAEPAIKNQEMLFGPINYWEGPLKISGTFDGRDVSGRGFLELTGYEPKCGLPRLVRQELQNAISYELKGVRQMLHGM